MGIELTHKENLYVLKLLMSDIRRMDKLRDHANAHSENRAIPDHRMANDIRLYLIHDLTVTKDDISDLPLTTG